MIWACKGCFCQMHCQRVGKARKSPNFIWILGYFGRLLQVFLIWFHFRIPLYVMCIYDLPYLICSMEFPWQKLLSPIIDDECSSLQNSRGCLLLCYLLQYNSCSLMTIDWAGACKSNRSWFSYIKGSKLWLHGAKVMTGPKSFGHKSSFHAWLGPIIPRGSGLWLRFQMVSSGVNTTCALSNSISCPGRKQNSRSTGNYIVGGTCCQILTSPTPYIIYPCYFQLIPLPLYL